ncbi:hypothetical protein pb186bvf_017265 [Paramecium bursaria]
MFLLFFLRITSANIWDNMFGNYDAPQIDIPNDFKVQLGYEFMRQPLLLDISYSTQFKAIHIKTKVQSIDKTIQNIYVNLEQGEIIVNQANLFGSTCQIFVSPDITSNIITKSSNSNIKMEPQVVFQVISLYMGTDDNDLIRYDISALLPGDNRIYALFNQDKSLNKIEVVVKERTISFPVTDDLVEKQFTQQDFQVPSDWKLTSPNLFKRILRFLDFIINHSKNLMMRLGVNNIPHSFESMQGNNSDYMKC